MTDPDTVRQQKIDAFAAAVAPSLDNAGAVHQHGPMGGHEWRWSNELGVWALNAGGMIDAGPRVTGPGIDNRWHLLEHTLRHADLVLLMLQLAGGIPGPDRPVAQIAGSDLWPAEDGPGRTYAFSQPANQAPRSDLLIDLAGYGADNTGDMTLGDAIRYLGADPDGVTLIDEGGAERRFNVDAQNVIRIPAGSYKIPARPPAAPEAESVTPAE